jgi:pimeloyl-ACP methyl ester carboxylesterase
MTQALPDLHRLYSRFLYFGIPYGDLQYAIQGADDWLSFEARLAETAAAREALGETAVASGRTQSAIEYFRSASTCFHFAQVRLKDWNQRSMFQAACRASYRKMARLLSPEVIPVDIPFRDGVLPGYVRQAEQDAPWVIVIGGVDSEKEVELHMFAEIFLRRGCSVCYFDGPGQGELLGRIPMSVPFEAAVAAVMDFLTTTFNAPMDGFGCFGVSFGGYLACRAAAADRRISACVNLGGFFDGSIFPGFPATAVDNLRRAFCLAPGEDIIHLAPSVTLEPLRSQLKAPLFIIHGGDDHLIGLEQIEALRDWTSGPVELWIMEGAEHVCTNRFQECLPRIGDWMTERLKSSFQVEAGVAAV